MSDLIAWADLGQLDLWSTRNLLVLATLMVGGLLRGFVGFGAALVIIPIVSLLYSPKEAVALHAVIEIPALFRLVPIAVRHADGKLVWPLIVGLAVMMPIGSWFLAYIDPEIMTLAIAIIVLTLVILIASDWRYRGRIGKPVSFTTGAVSGMIQGAAGVGGPPIVAVLLSRPDPPDIIRGNILAAMAAIHVIAIGVYGAYGFFTKDIIILGILFSPPFILAISLGARHYDKGGSSYYRRAALTVLACVALVSLFTVLTS